MAEKQIKVADLEWGFFRYDKRIFFGYHRGKFFIYFQVIDGKIQQGGPLDVNLYPNTSITYIPIEDMAACKDEHGMDIGPDDDVSDERFWESAA